MLVVGSSLTVHPICGVVPVAKQAGAEVVIVNAQQTPYDHLAAVVLDAPIGEALPAVLDTCGEEAPWPDC